jgi:hypothetical protein
MIDVMRLGEPQTDPVVMLTGIDWYAVSAIKKQPVVPPPVDHFQ